MLRLWVFMTIMCCASGAMAADEGLYPDAIDPTAGFLRVIAPQESLIVVDGRRLAPQNGGLTPFVILPEGQIDVAWSSGRINLDITAGAHLLLLLQDDIARTEPVAITNQPGKADVTLVNLSDVGDLTLHVPQAKADIFADLAADATATRALRAPLQLDFEFQSAGRTLASLTGVRLDRKAGVTFVLQGQGGDYTAYVSRNRYEK